MTLDPLPIVAVPGLLCSPRLYAAQMATLWQHGPVQVANHRRDGTIAAIAQRILAAAPPRFALVGLSMGGYIAFEMMRQAADRILRLALLDTSARPETPAQTAVRDARIALAETGRFAAVTEQSFPAAVHPSRRGDAALRAIVDTMAAETGPTAFVRQQRAIIGRTDSRPMLGAIRCPTLVLVGDSDALTPPDEAAEMAEGIAGAIHVVVPDCGHLATIERPEAVNAALAAWLAI